LDYSLVDFIRAILRTAGLLSMAVSNRISRNAMHARSRLAVLVVVMLLVEMSATAFAQTTFSYPTGGFPRVDTVRATRYRNPFSALLRFSLRGHFLGVTDSRK
jgi:hypothetical protein